MAHIPKVIGYSRYILPYKIGEDVNILDEAIYLPRRHDAYKEFNSDVTVPHSRRGENIKIMYTYPLAGSYLLTFENEWDGDWTVKDFVEAVYNGYQYIYNLEEETTTVEVVPLASRRKLLNRNETNGVFGVWGHDLDDLFLEGVNYNHETDVYFIVMGS